MDEKKREIKYNIERTHTWLRLPSFLSVERRVFCQVGDVVEILLLILFFFTVGRFVAFLLCGGALVAVVILLLEDADLVSIFHLQLGRGRLQRERDMFVKECMISHPNMLLVAVFSKQIEQRSIRIPYVTVERAHGHTHIFLLVYLRS